MPITHEHIDAASNAISSYRDHYAIYRMWSGLIALICLFLGGIIHPATRKLTLKLTAFFIIFLLVLPIFGGVVILLSKKSISLAIIAVVVATYLTYVFVSRIINKRDNEIADEEETQQNKTPEQNSDNF